MLGFLKKRAGSIVKKAAESIEQVHPRHSDADRFMKARDRLVSILSVVQECLGLKSTEPMTRYAENVAAERFSSGFDLDEVQTAFNLLEDAIWTQLSQEPDLGGPAKGFHEVRRVLRLGKDRLTRNYLAFAEQARTPVVDVRALFDGTTIAADEEALSA
jgi:hypothetical protein